MGKDKEKKKKEKSEGGDDGEQKPRHVSPISNPLAGSKLTKKVLKTIKKASKAKMVRRGVKEARPAAAPHAQRRPSRAASASAQVVKALKKEEQGVCIIAGDISPIDVIAHVPILCEEKNIPYVYVPSKEELGEASSTKRPTVRVA